MSSSESSTILVKPRPKLSDMPYKIKEMIAESTDFKTRYTLRKVSTHFRAAVDTSKFNYEFVKLDVERESINMRVDWVNNVEYRKHGENGCVVKKNRNGTEKIIEGENFIQKAVDDLAIILKSPKVFVKFLLFENFWWEETNIVHCLQAMLRSFRHKLSVRDLITFETNQDQVLQLLNLLKPGTLKKLVPCLDDNCDRIVETEHWSFLEETIVGNVEGVPISKFLHLKRFAIGDFPLTKDDVEQIVQSILQRPNNFEEYVFYTGTRIPIWREALSDYWPARPKIPIPGTDYQLSIEFYEHRKAIFKRYA